MVATAVAAIFHLKQILRQARPLPLEHIVKRNREAKRKLEVVQFDGWAMVAAIVCCMAACLSYVAKNMFN